jgi:putative ABC transport system permease protein
MLELERTWKQIVPDRLFDAAFFDQRIRSNYAEMVSFAWAIGFLGLLGMVIACMGLLGITMYTVETKAKEISLRKILGASVGDLTVLLSKGYFLVLGIAALIATALTWLVGSQLLQEFEQRISMSVWLFLPGILVLALIAGLTVGSQTVRAALANPVKSLRSE